MAAIYKRRKTWWLRFYHPESGDLVRVSLGTPDPARAELLKERAELELKLCDPRMRIATLPSPVLDAIGRPTNGTDETAARAATDTGNAVRTLVDDAVLSYVKFIRKENAPRHAAVKVSMLRRFLGNKRIDRLVPDEDSAKPKCRRQSVGVFKGEYLDEITPALLQHFLDGLDVSKKTRRHYRECFHHLFQHCLKHGLYRPDNPYCPNPAAALPSYVDKNRQIVFLTPGEVDAQLAALEPEPSFCVAAALMIHAGLRRAEVLWLTRDSIAPDLSFLSIVNRKDPDTELESSLKTGERAVTIIPALRGILAAYLPSLETQWVVPKRNGTRWNDDAFGKRLGELNREASLSWNCLHYRHTYATQRAAQGWSLFRIAHEMGNSVPVVTEYYAAYCRPEGSGVMEQGHPHLRVLQGAAG